MSVNNRQAVLKALDLAEGHKRQAVATRLALELAQIVDERDANRLHRSIEGVIQDLKRLRVIHNPPARYYR